MANVKFFKGTCTDTTKYEAGGIYFDLKTREIRLGKDGTTAYDAYGNGIKDAVLNGSVLTISFHDATKKSIVLDFSDIASATDTGLKFKELGTRVTTLEGKVGDETKGLVKGLADVKTTADAADALSKTNKTAIDTINGDGDGSITKAVADAKTDLRGDAAAEYNTLGKLEDKIQEEASRADAAEKVNAKAISDEITRAKAAEKKNADAATAAKDAADNAQATADAKVASVTAKDGETAIEVDNTTATTPKISLKLDNDGNVQFVQTAKGLKGSVEIPEATVTGVKADDKFLSLADKLVSADVSIAYDNTDKKIYLYGKDKNKANAVSSIDCTDFIKDGMLDSASLVTNPEGQTAGTYIKLTWNTDSGKKDPMYINVTSLIDIYTAKADGGLKLEDHAFSVDTNKIATVESVNGVASRVTTLEDKVGSAKVGETPATGLYKDIADNKAAIAAETTRATAAEDALLGTDGDDATKDTIKGAKKAVEDLKAQIKADAVTLTIPDDDPYITASKAEGSNTYTISSKKDGTTPLVDVKINTKLTEKINSLDGGGTSPAVKGVTVTVNETDGIVATPSISIADGTIGGASDTNLVTGDTVKTYVDTAITNAALVWNDIPTTA